MANNRIYIRCKGCGATLFLGKTFSDGYYWQPYGGEPLEDQLNEFYDKHTYCSLPKEKEKRYDKVLEDALERMTLYTKMIMGRVSEIRRAKKKGERND